ncbi:hypothetical protein CTI12_AA450640 [Artemisia annua]|uniref:RRM domain-containing protein n=1 Tax=Artemisia annua TaxID=35608 RepID=A0A2U1LUN8_ARTAN|nr:hypothetical protein CTI12_AA450640 [Artemisia annua]
MTSVIREKATSFFFTNFPELWGLVALRRMYNRYGKVVDVYIAFKRSTRDTRLRFMKFINIGDIGSFERRLKGILIGTSKLVINSANFIKVGGMGVPASDFHTFNSGGQHNPKVSEHPSSMSFKKVVLSPNGHTKTHVKTISIEENAYLRSKIECCWIGETKTFQVL